MKKEIAIAFAGGGCRIIEWAYICRILEGNYEIKAVTGVSSGSFMAMNIAAGLKPDEVVKSLRQNYKNYNTLKFAPKLHLGYGLFSTEPIGNAMAKVCEAKGIYKMTDFPMPIAIKAADCRTGDTVLFTNLNIESGYGLKVIKNASPKDAIMASCAFSGVYTAVWVTDDDGNRVLCADGALRGNLCVTPLKKCFPELETWGCVFADKKKSKPKNFLPGIIDTLVRKSIRALTDLERRAADKVIELPKLSGIKLLDVKCQHFDRMLISGAILLTSREDLFKINEEFEKKLYDSFESAVISAAYESFCRSLR